MSAVCQNLWAPLRSARFRFFRGREESPGGAAGGAEGSDNEDEAVVGGGRGEHVPPDTGSPLELSGSADSSSPPSEDEDE